MLNNLVSGLKDTILKMMKAMKAEFLDKVQGRQVHSAWQTDHDIVDRGIRN